MTFDYQIHSPKEVGPNGTAMCENALANFIFRPTSGYCTRRVSYFTVERKHQNCISVVIITVEVPHTQQRRDVVGAVPWPYSDTH